ncbi:SRPBCC family protein [Limibacillus halophilus]|uniref:Carbon monoxide dehydrogenase subunit G n=1 Tax=Limibacillus halophilus TaxID=1579333 RepID=A0A839SU12_9PROT|nr:carbon monoxide dehydrogenase subunit G [Limibacillus halophilus]MBB3065479.1 hypothetical protein [Limibacillus halophilus]
MQMTGEVLIPASREKVWDALNDPEVLRQSIPGCQSLDRSEDGGFDAKVKAKVGPVSATFGGHVVLEDLVPPESYTLSGEGKGGAAGFAKGNAKVKLTTKENGTLLSYEVDAKVGGKLAQIGSRLIDGTAKKLSDEFFATFSQIVSSGSGGPTDGLEQAIGAHAQGQSDDGSPTQAPSHTPPHTPLHADPDEALDKQEIEEALAEAKRKPGLSPLVWISGLVAIIILLIVMFGRT